MRTKWLRLAGLGSVKHLETNSIAYCTCRSTDEIEFYLPKNNAVLFCSQNSGTNLNCEIKFPFKRKGLPSSSVSMHVKARNVSQIPRPYQGFCPGPKHFIVNCNKTILN